VDVRAQGIGVPLRDAGGAEADRAADRLVGQGWVLRVSVQAYNDASDLAALRDALSES